MVETSAYTDTSLNFRHQQNGEHGHPVMDKADISLEPPFRRELLVTSNDTYRAEPEIPILPATYRTKHHVVRLVNSDLHAFLESDLDLDRLNRVHKWFWLVGLPTSPRPLHYQRLKKRDIVVTEQLDLHLVWSPTRIFIKPLPRYMCSPHFWQYSICPDPNLHSTALGFLLSYIALIEREVDLHIAHDLNLIPKCITWPAWLSLAEEVVISTSRVHAYTTSPPPTSNISALESRFPVNSRFHYGELRLGRLNWIYRLSLGIPRGYLSGCTTYGAFIRDNINSLITLFAYTTIVLSAMQVGLATPWLMEDYAFGMASYVFSVFSILAPLSAIMAIIFVISVQFLINLSRTLHIRRKRRRQGVGV